MQCSTGMEGRAQIKIIITMYKITLNLTTKVKEHCSFVFLRLKSVCESIPVSIFVEVLPFHLNNLYSLHIQETPEDDQGISAEIELCYDIYVGSPMGLPFSGLYMTPAAQTEITILLMF